MPADGSRPKTFRSIRDRMPRPPAGSDAVKAREFVMNEASRQDERAEAIAFNRGQDCDSVPGPTRTFAESRDGVLIGERHAARYHEQSIETKSVVPILADVSGATLVAAGAAGQGLWAIPAFGVATFKYGGKAVENRNVLGKWPCFDIPERSANAAFPLVVMNEGAASVMPTQIPVGGAIGVGQGGRSMIGNYARGAGIWVDPNQTPMAIQLDSDHSYSVTVANPTAAIINVATWIEV